MKGLVQTRLLHDHRKLVLAAVKMPWPGAPEGRKSLVTGGSILVEDYRDQTGGTELLRKISLVDATKVTGETFVNAVIGCRLSGHTQGAEEQVRLLEIGAARFRRSYAHRLAVASAIRAADLHAKLDQEAGIRKCLGIARRSLIDLRVECAFMGRPTDADDLVRKIREFEQRNRRFEPAVREALLHLPI